MIEDGQKPMPGLVQHCLVIVHEKMIAKIHCVASAGISEAGLVTSCIMCSRKGILVILSYPQRYSEVCRYTCSLL